MEKKTIIFDMDGLMFDTTCVFRKAWDYAGEKMGLGKVGYMIEKTLGMSIMMSRDIWMAEFGERYKEDELRKLTKEFLLEYYSENSAPVKNGLYVLLNYLKENDYKLGVASSAPEWEVENHLKKAGVYTYFNAIVHGGMVHKSKPEPDIYYKACELLNERQEDCLVLEDSKSGLLAAYRAGCKVIMVPDLWQPDEETEKILWKKFEDLEEVKVYLEKEFL